MDQNQKCFRPNHFQEPRTQPHVANSTFLLAPKLTNKADFVEIPSLGFDDELEDVFSKVGMHFKEIEVNQMQNQRRRRFMMNLYQRPMNSSLNRCKSQSSVTKSRKHGILKQYDSTLSETPKFSKSVRFNLKDYVNPKSDHRHHNQHTLSCFNTKRYRGNQSLIFDSF